MANEIKPATPTVPVGTPSTDPTKPAWMLTQDQINFLVNQVTTFWPAFKQYWPQIMLVAGMIYGAGHGVGRYTAPTPSAEIVNVPGPVVTTPADPKVVADHMLKELTKQPK